MSNRERAEALMEDIQEYAPERAKETSVEWLEKFLDGLDEKERRMMEAEKKKMPLDWDSPLEYERELNWKRQQVQELINEEISQLYR